MQRPRSSILANEGIYHVGTRGIRRLPIVADEVDRHFFLGLLGDVSQKLNWTCLSYCLMTSHYHALVRTPEPDLPVGLQRLNYAHARRFNLRHGFTGHLFEQRYFAEPIETDAQLVATAQYIELNPVRAGLCAGANEWPWSSCAAILDLRQPLPWFDPRPLLELLDHDVARARVEYAVRLAAAAGRNGHGPMPDIGT